MHEIVPKLADGTRFCLDAVQGCASKPWSLDDAIRVGHEAAALGARWYEEPCAAEDHAGYAAVRKAADTSAPSRGHDPIRILPPHLLCSPATGLSAFGVGVAASPVAYMAWGGPCVVDGIELPSRSLPV